MVIVLCVHHIHLRFVFHCNCDSLEKNCGSLLLNLSLFREFQYLTLHSKRASNFPLNFSSIYSPYFTLYPSLRPLSQVMHLHIGLLIKQSTTLAYIAKFVYTYDIFHAFIISQTHGRIRENLSSKKSNSTNSCKRISLEPCRSIHRHRNSFSL